MFGDLFTLLGMSFFQRALIGGCLVSVICAAIGLFVVLRKESMIGDSAAHISFGGIAVGLLLGVQPMIMATVFSVAAILGMDFMKKRGIAQSDSAMAIFMAMGFSVGLIAIGLSNGFSISIMDYLFGSILTISGSDLAVISVLGIAVLSAIFILLKEFIAMTFDSISSKMNGIPTELLSVLFNVMMAVTVVLTIKVVGIILVLALMVVPSLAALQLKTSFRKTLLAAVMFGAFSTFTGIIVSGMVDLPAAGVIVFTDVAILLLLVAYKHLGKEPGNAVPPIKETKTFRT
ncbi:MAG: metal ABC transporter permease [Candidatus Methanoplasma sp.]|nr:metal ABC transporter permease [Candidatus Methanoplasma sp.]